MRIQKTENIQIDFTLQDIQHSYGADVWNKTLEITTEDETFPFDLGKRLALLHEFMPLVQ